MAISGDEKPQGEIRFQVLYLTANKILAQIRITGLFDRKDESKARAEAESVKGEIGPYTVGYDADLGWIILPQTAILPNPDSAPGNAVPARVPAAHAKAGSGDKDVR